MNVGDRVEVLAGVGEGGKGLIEPAEILTAKVCAPYGVCLKVRFSDGFEMWVDEEVVREMKSANSKI